MMKTFRGGALLLGALALASMAQAQQALQRLSADVAVTYTTERAKIATEGCACFWLQGGSADVAVPLFRGLAVAANLTGDQSSNIAPGVDISKLTFMAGPRFSLSTGRWTRHLPRWSHATGLFGEALFGTAHGFDSSFPTSSGTKSSANSLSMQFGGGMNVRLARGFGVRAFELDYVRTNFRNSGSNLQNDLRLAIGVTYHLGER
jgi:peptidoglycan-associated lipoprotein